MMESGDALCYARPILVLCWHCAYVHGDQRHPGREQDQIFAATPAAQGNHVSCGCSVKLPGVKRWTSVPSMQPQHVTLATAHLLKKPDMEAQQSVMGVLCLGGSYGNGGLIKFLMATQLTPRLSFCPFEAQKFFAVSTSRINGSLAAS